MYLYMYSDTCWCHTKRSACQCPALWHASTVSPKLTKLGVTGAAKVASGRIRQAKLCCIHHVSCISTPALRQKLRIGQT